MAYKKLIDLTLLDNFLAKIKGIFVSTITYDSTNKKITKTINGTTSDVVTASALKSDMSLNNVENKSSATIRGELTKANVTTALGYTPPETDTTYENKAAASGGTDLSLVTTGEKATWNAKTSNTGTITGINMNGASKGTSGVVDLGTVITEHQSLAAYRTAAAQNVIDAEKYEKPSSGIPKSDLDPLVQMSLNRADEAMTLGVKNAAVGDLARVNWVDANGKPTSWRKAPLCEIRTNLNLLDDWLFTNPVNQRGQTTWQNAGEYTVDRWKLTSGTASLGASGLTLNGTLVQIREKAIGQPVTCSALLSDDSMITPTYNDSTKTFTITATGQTIKAVKLELGSEQTLAHQENGQWVLNEIPDYAEELAKCQRYYLPDCGRFCNAYYYGDVAGVMDITIPTPVTMIDQIAVELGNSDYVIRSSDNTALLVSASLPVGALAINANAVIVRVSNLTFGTPFTGLSANMVINLKSTT